MRSALTLAAIVWSFWFAHGPVARLLPAELRDRLTQAVVTGGLSLGLITLVPLWVMLVWPGGPAFPLAFGASIVLFVVDRAARGRGGEADRPPVPRSRPAWSHESLPRALIVAIAACSAAILFNAAYWPFAINDALALYAPFGKHLYRTASLPVGDRLYEAYPMLVPMAYALTHWVRGAVDEYLARLVPGVMAVGVVGVAGALGRAMATPGVGLVASALVALTPVFGRWASSGYTDVPVALYVGLTALFAWRWWLSGDPRAAVLTGIAAGLAMWTKNSALALLPSLAWLILTRRGNKGRRAMPPPAGPAWAAALILGGIVLAAGPWYARNLLVFGFLLPPTMLTDRARHDPSSLLLMLRGDQHFGVCGWLFTAALLYGPLALLASRAGRGRWHVLLAFAAPFLAAWWWLASYEARFLMAVLPLLATMSALMLADAAAWLRPRLTAAGRRRAALAAAALTLVATPVSVRKAVEHKAVLLRHPFPDDAERHRVRLGGLYDLATALNRLPVGSRVAGVPAILRYHLDVDRFATVSWGSATARPPTLAARYDYVVYQGGDGEEEPCGGPSRTDALLRTSDGYVLCRTSRSGAPTAAREPRGQEGDG
jgi:hypothetical protein